MPFRLFLCNTWFLSGIEMNTIFLFIEINKYICVVRLTDRPNMTIAVDWDVKNQTKT